MTRRVRAEGFGDGVEARNTHADASVFGLVAEALDTVGIGQARFLLTVGAASCTGIATDPGPGLYPSKKEEA